MAKYEILAIGLLLFIGGTSCQENAKKIISPSLIECYDNELYGKYNLLPHTMETFIAIVRKIEQSANFNMNLRQLSTALLHRFSQDGIELNPDVKPQAGVMPYAALGNQFYRHAQTLRTVPGNAVTFPNNSISVVERCTLHSMLSSSIDVYKHSGENRGCKTSNYGMNYNYGFRRWRRHVKRPKDDVETLSPEQVEMLMSKDQADPNSEYPAFPPNHPSASARITEDQYSECPIENGVLKTPWGPVSGGSVLAGIASGLTHQVIRVSELIKQLVEPRMFSGLSTDSNLDNRFLSTLAGDLAEVALAQGPQFRGQFTVGADGNWNSTSQPLYYFLGTKNDLQMTGAEIRGDIDGLILATEVPRALGKFGGLYLSQVLDMYYSDRGLLDNQIRACNRRAQLPNVAPTEMLVAQTCSSAIVLSSIGYATVTIFPEKIENFSAQAVKDFSDFVPTMSKDNVCEFFESNVKTSQPAVDLTIVLDTNWPFENIQSVLAQLLSSVEVCKYNSNFTIMNGQNGNFIVNSSNSLLDFVNFNRTNYNQLAKGFDLALSITKIQELEQYKLDKEKLRGFSDGKSDVVVIMPYHINLSPTDREFVYKTLEDMRKEIPDTKVLFLTYERKDGLTDLVEDSSDIISINFSENMENNPAIDEILTKIKQVPRRLVNTQCGSRYDQTGNSRSLTNFVGPNGVNFYRIHPNYFMTSSDDKPKVKVQGVSGSPLKVCWSRELLHVNASAAQAGATCNTITGKTQSIEMNCDGVSYIHQCKPYYISVGSDSNGTGQIQCLDRNECRYPNDIRYVISYENLVCKSSASALFVAPLFVMVPLVRILI
ncbi:uncharacterized protein LOC131670311 [Phymastichus coffea]|uniref:uncharacterized protein LOC131670311 n=1 Tax=Phymastichus coffea TaxID=108790 RepID=UPI00273B6E6F|nr:uncharacterized protein LOC131670311 [Phymastichus coffea]